MAGTSPPESACSTSAARSGAWWGSRGCRRRSEEQPSETLPFPSTPASRSGPPCATVPCGILIIRSARCRRSGSTSESGADDMMAAFLLRGRGLGFLFLSITLIAFSRLDGRHLATGIGLFNIGRQIGGLVGVAGLQTLIEHGVATNAAVLGAHAAPGAAAVTERQIGRASCRERVFQYV